MKQKQLLKHLPMLVLLGFAACNAKVDNRGYVSESPIKDQVKVGSMTKEEVLAKLGSPSSQSTFGDETWYYISARKEGIAFMKPEITQQDVTRIEFGADGKVKLVETYDKDASQDLTIVKRTTPTEGHTLGFMEQVLGNIGRFNKPSDSGTNSAAPGRRQTGGLPGR